MLQIKTHGKDGGIGFILVGIKTKKLFAYYCFSNRICPEMGLKI
jgi:hypothetical protein